MKPRARDQLYVLVQREERVLGLEHLGTLATPADHISQVGRADGDMNSVGRVQHVHKRATR